MLSLILIIVSRYYSSKHEVSNMIELLKSRLQMPLFIGSLLGLPEEVEFMELFDAYQQMMHVFF